MGNCLKDFSEATPMNRKDLTDFERAFIERFQLMIGWVGDDEGAIPQPAGNRLMG
jgi:hypothetical protein